MSDLPVTFTFSNLPQGYCFTTPGQYATDLFALISGTVSGGGFNQGADTPSVDNRDLVWVRTSSGALEGIYTFDNTYGLWTRPHPIPPSSNYRGIWVGTLAALKTFEGGVDEAVTATTGPFWEEATELRFRVPVGCGTNGTTYDGKPASTINVGDTGGDERHTLVADEIPDHYHLVAKDATGDVADPGLTGSNTINDAGTSGEPSYVLTGSSGVPTMGRTGNGNVGGLSHENMPPWYGVYFIKRTARQFFTVAG